MAKLSYEAQHALGALIQEELDPIAKEESKKWEEAKEKRRKDLIVEHKLTAANKKLEDLRKKHNAARDELNSYSDSMREANEKINQIVNDEFPTKKSPVNVYQMMNNRIYNIITLHLEVNRNVDISAAVKKLVQAELKKI